MQHVYDTIDVFIKETDNLNTAMTLQKLKANLQGLEIHHKGKKSWFKRLFTK